MDLNAWFHWLFPSPGYFLLGLAGLFVLFGLIGGLTDSRTFTEAGDTPPDDDGDQPSSKPWWKRDEEPYIEWNAHQARQQRRTAEKHSALE